MVFIRYSFFILMQLLLPLSYFHLGAQIHQKSFLFTKVPAFGWHQKQYQSCRRKELVLINWISILCFSLHSPAETSQCFFNWHFSLNIFSSSSVELKTCGGLSERIHPQFRILITFWIRLACILLVTNCLSTGSIEQSTWLPCCFVYRSRRS